MKQEVFTEAGFAADMERAEAELQAIRQAGKLPAYDGCPLYYEYYPAQKAQGALVMVHGFTEFSAKYRELCWYFLQQGYWVFLFDLRGHGLSGRQVEDPALAHVDSYGDYVRDLDSYMEQVVRPAVGRLPVYLFGHSMGGAVATLYLMQKGSGITKAVLSSPMVIPVTPLPAAYLSRYTKKIAQKQGWEARFPHASTFHPDPPFERSSDTSESRFRRHIALRRSDVRYQNSSATNGWMYQTLNVGKQILQPQVLRTVPTKILLLQAGRDRVVRRRPQEKLASLLPHCRVEKFPTAKHTIFNAEQSILQRYVDLLLDFLAED